MESYLFTYGYEEEVMTCEGWKQLNNQLVETNDVPLESFVKPYSNSSFLWVDSDFDFANGQLSSASKKILLHYRIWKSDRNTDENPRVIFLIHGVGSSTAGWRHCVDSLLEKFEIVVAIDMPGFGFSSRIAGLSHSRWNRAFWCAQLMNAVSRTINVSDAVISWTVFAHSMSCLFCPCLAWLVNQNELTNFEKYLVDDNSKRFFKIDTVIMAAGTYFKSNLSEMLNYSIVQSITRMTLKLILGKTVMSNVLKNSLNRLPNNEELSSYTIPLCLKNSVDCLVDILKSFKKDDGSNMDKHLEILNDLTKWCRVIQIVAKSDNLHSMEEALKLKSILESQEHANKFTYKLFETASHCLMETDIQDFNNYITNELTLQ